MASLDDVAAHLDGRDSAAVLLLDVDGTVAPQGAPPAEVDRLVNAALDRFGSLAGVSVAMAVSNGPPRGVSRMVARSNKPWTTRNRLGLAAEDTVVVVGDQILTDGLLAWRWGGSFLHLVDGGAINPARQQLMARVGRLIAGLFFRSP